MRILESLIVWGLMLLGTIVLAVGYLTSIKVIRFGRLDSLLLTMALEEIGFILIAAGLLTWLIISVLKTLELI